MKIGLVKANFPGERREPLLPKDIKDFKNEINKIKDGEISDEEFEASKKSIISDLKEWNDSKIALSKMFISNLFSLKNDSLTLEQMVDKFEKVTKQDIIDIASKITIEKIYFLGGENNA